MPRTRQYAADQLQLTGEGEFCPSAGYVRGMSYLGPTRARQIEGEEIELNTSSISGRCCLLIYNTQPVRFIDQSRCSN